MKIYALAALRRRRIGASFVLAVSLSLAALVLTVGAAAMQRTAPPATPTAGAVPARLASEHESEYVSPVDSTLGLLHGSFLLGEPGLTRAADARLDAAAAALGAADAAWTVEWSERDAALAAARAAHLRERLERRGLRDRVRVVARKGVPGVRAYPAR